MKVLITDDVHPSLMRGLELKGYTVDFKPSITFIEVLDIIGQYEAIVFNTKIKIKKELIDQAIKLKVAARLGSGKEIIDLDYCFEKGIKVITCPEANCNAVAEHALGMILALLRHIPRTNQDVRNFIWEREKNRGEEISSKKIGIIGYGHTGRRFSELLTGFGCKIYVYDAFEKIVSNSSQLEIVESMDKLKDCDIISLHVNLLPQNKHMINETFVSSMDKPFYLINTSRGLVIDTQALISGLKTGKIKGACLDVFENEQVSSFQDEERMMYSELYKFPNLILSPHIAGWTIESKYEIAQSILRQWPN